MGNTLNAQILEFQKAFGKVTRDDRSTFFILKDDSPEWMTEIIRACHDGCMPCDIIYDGIVTILDSLINYDFDAIELDDIIYEVSDDFINNYNLWTWARDFSDSSQYIEEYREELCYTDTILNTLCQARRLWLQFIANTIISELHV